MMSHSMRRRIDGQRSTIGTNPKEALAQPRESAGISRPSFNFTSIQLISKSSTSFVDSSINKYGSKETWKTCKSKSRG